MFFPFNVALAMIGFFVSTVASNSKASNTASYAIVLLAIVVQSFVSDNNLLTFIFTTNASSLVGFLRAFLVIYPPFSYTKVSLSLYRSSQTSQFIQDIILTSSKDHGSREYSPILGMCLRSQPADPCLLEEEHTTDILILSLCSSYMQMLPSTLCLHGISTTLSPPIVVEATLSFSQSIEFSNSSIAKLINHSLNQARSTFEVKLLEKAWKSQQ